MSDIAISNTPEFRAWCAMRQRCSNPKHQNWDRYGGRGIKVCDRWLNSFDAFLADMGSRPSPEHTLDRYPNNDGNYEPGNCRWATRKEQANNRGEEKDRPKHIGFRAATWVHDAVLRLAAERGQPASEAAHDLLEAALRRRGIKAPEKAQEAKKAGR